MNMENYIYMCYEQKNCMNEIEWNQHTDWVATHHRTITCAPVGHDDKNVTGPVF